MKSLELNIAKKLLVFDWGSKSQMDAFLESDFTLQHKEKDCKVLFNGLNLTEESAKELVDSMNFGTYENIDIGYCNYIKENYSSANALQSFISAINKEGFYWLENPNGTQPHNIGLIKNYPTGHPLMDISLKEAIDWQESESHTLRFPIIFEILEE